MIDIHCHILPDIDDGPKTFDESLAMARIAAEDGITGIVATPHLNERLYSPVEISRRVSSLRLMLRKENIPLSIMMGADVSVLFRPDQVEGFTINGTNYILIEFAHSHLPRNADAILFQFLVKGFWPIITHPERNPSISADPNLLRQLLGDKIYVQITAGSLTGDFGNEARHCAEYLLRAGVVDVIATDAHSSTKRKPILSEGMRAAAKFVGPQRARQMVVDAPTKIIRGISL